MGRFLSLDPLADAGGQQVLSPYHAMGCNPVSMVDPLGLKYFGPQDNVESAALANAGIHVFDDGTVAVFGGTNTFDYEGDYISQREHSEALFREHAGEYEKASEAKSGNKKGDNTKDNQKSGSGGRTKPNADYMVFNGTTITVYDGEDNHVIVTYEATSGMPGYQNSGNQKIKDSGPLPEGKYVINLKLDPKRESKVNNKTGELHPGNGIEKVPSTFTTVDGNRYSYPGWGNMRAKLNPVSGNMYGRSAFYLHDSHKGYSHGCIEVNSGLFNTLIGYSYFRPSITLYVRYPNSNSSTNGGTYKP